MPSGAGPGPRAVCCPCLCYWVMNFCIFFVQNLKFVHHNLCYHNLCLKKRKRSVIIASRFVVLVIYDWLFIVCFILRQWLIQYNFKTNQVLLMSLTPARGLCLRRSNLLSVLHWQERYTQFTFVAKITLKAVQNMTLSPLIKLL